jgi:hypothetical protein
MSPCTHKRRAAVAGLLWTLLITAILAGLPLVAQTLSKRLILKDGSYQVVTKWETKGERVRFYSAERSQWEEIPNSLVDWDATNKYNADLATRSTARPVTADLKELDEEEKAERAKEEAASPEVALGIRLPSGGGVYMIDTYRGTPQLVEMGQSGGEVNKQTGKNILRAAINPLALSTKQTIELPGAHSSVQAHEPDPEFYVNMGETGGTVEGAGGAKPSPAGYRIVRVESKKASRVVGSLKIALTGRVTEQANIIATTTKPVAGSWVKVIPAAPLAMGEYALVEMLNEKEMNLYVWDFGVNPSANQNSGAWKPPVDPKVAEQEAKDKERAAKEKERAAKKPPKP